MTRVLVKIKHHHDWWCREPR